MKIHFPTEVLERVVQESVKQAIQDSLPTAIRKATRKKYLTTKEVAEILSCTRRHVQALRDSKKLPFIQSGRTIRYDIDEVESYLNRGRVNTIKEE